MIDQSRIDLLSLVNIPLKRVGNRYVGPCPICRAGEDRFVIENERWFCRQCKEGGTGGDAIMLYQGIHGVSFVEAVKALGLESQLKDTRGNAPALKLSHARSEYVTPEFVAPVVSDAPGLNNEEWLNRASAFVRWCWQNAKISPEFHSYMVGQRGLRANTLDINMVGYNPNYYKDTWGGVDVFLPPGIVIPYLDDFEGRPRKINIRRTDGKGAKYKIVEGSAGKWLFNNWQFKPGAIVVLVEGEIDALSVMSAVRHHKVRAVATGSTTGARWMRWVAQLAMADHVLVAFDADEPGQDAAVWWTRWLKDTAIRAVPLRHDINDMLKSGDNIARWIHDAIRSMR